MNTEGISKIGVTEAHSQQAVDTYLIWLVKIVIGLYEVYIAPETTQGDKVRGTCF